MGTRKIRVLIVDDSAVVRRTLSDVLSSDPEIEVIATAADPYVAAERIREQVPDVITLDIEMPRMDGLTFLQKVMTQHPIPVVICSSLAEEGAQSTLKALEYGAVDVITKPRLGSKQFLEDSRIILCQAVKAAAAAQLRVLRPSHVVQPKLTADAILSPATHAMAETTEKVVVIGASTGGTEALKTLLEALPPNAPGIVIVQHMPELFTRAFANRLDGPVRHHREGGGDERYRSAWAGSDRAGQPSLVAQAERRSVLRRNQRRTVSVPPPSFGRCFVSIRGSLRRTERGGSDSDGNGGRRRQRHAGNETSGGRDDRPGRGHLRGLRHA